MASRLAREELQRWKAGVRGPKMTHCCSRASFPCPIARACTRNGGVAFNGMEWTRAAGTVRLKRTLSILPAVVLGVIAYRSIDECVYRMMYDVFFCRVARNTLQKGPQLRVSHRAERKGESIGGTAPRPSGLSD